MKKVELLSPAGSKQALVGAVQSGADAVYLGGSCFNARQGAENFTAEEMKKWVDYCHLYGVLVYVTVNTLIKERETQDLVLYARELNEIGVDGVIVQDLGAVKLFSEAVPELPVHASTQMTVTSLSGVKYLEELGIKRVVLARELTREQISEISSGTASELEVFVHGALCMCYSGQCLISSIIGGRSGNRGRCAQPCRLSYTLLENGKSVYDGYLLSPKDLSLVDYLKDMKKSGVSSLKIEGRLKRPEYVAAVTSVYRKYLDSGERATDADKKILLDAFNRGGFTKGFFGNETAKKMMCHDNPSNTAQNIFPDFAKKMAETDEIFRKIPVFMYASARLGEPLSLTVRDEDANSVTVSGTALAEAAKMRPLDEVRLSDQLKKLGGTPFSAARVDADIDEGISLAISEINNVRRLAVQRISDARIKREARVEQNPRLHEKKERNKKIRLSVEVETEEQLRVALSSDAERIYAPEKLCTSFTDERIIPKLSDIAKQSKTSSNRLCVSNISDIFDNKDRKLYGGVRLNVYNSYTVEALGLECVTLSPELNVHELKEICAHTSREVEIIVYGRLTLMIMENCPVKACGFCARNGKKYSLRDRKNEEFPLLCTKNCQMRLLNSKPLYVADRWDEIKKTGADFGKLVFTIESESECAKIIENYKKAVSGKLSPSLPENTFTRGHFFRGVE